MRIPWQHATDRHLPRERTLSYCIASYEFENPKSGNAPMNPADDNAAKLVPTEGQSPGAVAGSHDNLEEQVHNLEKQLHDATLKDLQHTNHQSKPTADLHGSDDRLDEQLRVSVDALLHPSPPPKPVEEVDELLLAISHHLDDEASERKVIRNRLSAIDNATERLASRGFRYIVAICVGVAAILAWSYGETARQIIATKAPELGWSPKAKQMIASWVKPLAVESKAIPVTQAAPEKVAAKPAAPTLDPQQMQQIKTDIAVVGQTIERHLADVRATVEQLAASQSEMAREIQKLQAANREILEKISAPTPQPPAAPAHKPKPVHPPPKPTPFWRRLAPHP